MYTSLYLAAGIRKINSKQNLNTTSEEFLIVLRFFYAQSFPIAQTHNRSVISSGEQRSLEPKLTEVKSLNQ